VVVLGCGGLGCGGVLDYGGLGYALGFGGVGGWWTIC